MASSEAGQDAKPDGFSVSPAATSQKTLPTQAGEEAEHGPPREPPSVVPVSQATQASAMHVEVEDSLFSSDGDESSKSYAVNPTFMEDAAARLKKVELIQAELSSDMYANSVRLTKKGKERLAEWHRGPVQVLVQEGKKNKEVFMFRSHKFSVELLFRSMCGNEAKQNLDWIRSLLRDKKLEQSFSVIPPYTPEQNMLLLPCQTFFKALINEIEEKTQKSPVPKEWKPSTTYPIAEASRQMWSLELFDQTIASA